MSANVRKEAGKIPYSDAALKRGGQKGTNEYRSSQSKYILHIKMCYYSVFLQMQTERGNSMQSLGKISTTSRRMPHPAQIPSLKSSNEIYDQDEKLNEEEEDAEKLKKKEGMELFTGRIM